MGATCSPRHLFASAYDLWKRFDWSWLFILETILSFKHTPFFILSSLLRFDLSVVKQFSSPYLSVTLDYCTSHWIGHFFHIVCFFGTVFETPLCSPVSWVMTVPDYARGYLGRQHEPPETVTRPVQVHLQLFRMSSERSESPQQKIKIKVE